MMTIINAGRHYLHLNPYREVCGVAWLVYT